MNFRDMNEYTTIIVLESLAEYAIEIFPYIFDTSEPIFEAPIQDQVNANEAISSRSCLYSYDNQDVLSKVIELCWEKQIPIASFPRASGMLRSNFERFHQDSEMALVDMSSVSYAIEDNKNIIYLTEQFINFLPNVKYIVSVNKVDDILKYFPFYFQEHKNITELFPDILGKKDAENPESSGKKITVTSLEQDDIDNFLKYFRTHLFGHDNFKKRFSKDIRNFVSLNRAKVQPVFSIFLFGASGIGKTEVARLINDGLKSKSYLAKINFQNYSSQDALNSLIGSPPGYIGCEHGELSEKVKKSKVGLVLCDEFEKATRPVFSFFLELLEEGKFTDSMAREYDLDGYVIVFTSNIANEAEYKKIIPPELQTRFDLVCEFEEPSCADKRRFLEFLLAKAKITFADKFAIAPLTKEETEELLNFNYSSMSALRDIKRKSYGQLMDYFSRKIQDD